MKNPITYDLKCLRCGKITTYILRSLGEHSSINPMSDKDVFRIISEDSRHPQTTYYCEKCKKHTLQLHVGWDY